MITHVDYPHSPGTLYDCAACEAECHCELFDGEMLCVHCALAQSDAVDILDGVATIRYRDGGNRTATAYIEPFGNGRTAYVPPF